jgi:hypothetical protein
LLLNSTCPMIHSRIITVDIYHIVAAGHAMLINLHLFE